jgi:general secretion pathway protein E
VSANDLATVGLDPTLKLFRPAGCLHCGSTGYTGRVGIHEILTLDDEVRAVLGGAATPIQAAAVKSGKATLLYDQARKLCETGGTTVDELVRVLGEPD